MDTITLGPDTCRADDAFEAYRALYSSGTDVDRLPGPLRTEVVAHRLPRMLVFDRAASPGYRTPAGRAGSPATGSTTSRSTWCSPGA